MLDLNHIIPGLLLLEGVPAGVLAFVLYRNKSAKLERCERLWGEVVEVKEKRADGGTTRHPIVRFKASNGEEVTFESSFGSSNWKVQPGDRIEVLAPRDNPRNAEVVHFLAQWFIPMFCGIVSVGSIIAAAIIFLIAKQ